MASSVHPVALLSFKTYFGARHIDVTDHVTKDTFINGTVMINVCTLPFHESVTAARPKRSQSAQQLSAQFPNFSAYMRPRIHRAEPSASWTSLSDKNRIVIAFRHFVHKYSLLSRLN